MLLYSDGYLALVNEGPEQPARGEWSRLISPPRRFDHPDGGCLKFEYQSRYVDLDVHLLMTSESTSQSANGAHILDIQQDGQVRFIRAIQSRTWTQKC